MPKAQPEKVMAAHDDKAVAGTGRRRWWRWREWRLGVALIRPNASRHEQRRRRDPAECEFLCRFHIAFK
jgi:hypothetical protein